MGLYHQLKMTITFGNLINFIQIHIYKLEMIIRNPCQERLDEDHCI